MANHVENGKKPVYKNWWFWLVIFVVIVGIGGTNSTNKNNTTETTVSQAETQQVTKEEEIMEMDYRVLYQDYQDNPINADAKYKNKILKLTGIVGTIDREISQQTYITFDIDFLKNVRITFKKEQESKVANLSKGQTVTIKGKCTGTLLSSTVALNDCEIIE